MYLSDPNDCLGHMNWIDPRSWPLNRRTGVGGDLSLVQAVGCSTAREEVSTLALMRGRCEEPGRQFRCCFAI